MQLEKEPHVLAAPCSTEKESRHGLLHRGHRLVRRGCKHIIKSAGGLPAGISCCRKVRQHGSGLGFLSEAPRFGFRPSVFGFGKSATPSFVPTQAYESKKPSRIAAE